MNTKTTTTNTSMDVAAAISEAQSTRPIVKHSITSEVLRKTAESRCKALKTLKAEASGLNDPIEEYYQYFNEKYNTMTPILGENLIKRREITYLSGSQVFFSDKNEVVMRKSPNLVMSPYDCLRQLKC